MPDKALFDSNPRDYALTLVEECGLDAKALALALLVYMSCDDVREALDANELSPRFLDDEDDEDDEQEPDAEGGAP